MGIIKLLPPELLAQGGTGTGLAMVFAMLLAACAWNLGTWYFGIPASSSHTMIGSILGVGLGNALMNGQSLASGVNWSKAADVGLALLVSPLVGFSFAALGLFLLKRTAAHSVIHQAPQHGTTAPLGVRMALIGTCTGVSLAHGSNDGQKGVGLIMLILIAVLPAQYALRPETAGSLQELETLRNASQQIELKLGLASRSFADGPRVASTSPVLVPANNESMNPAVQSVLLLNREIRDLISSGVDSARDRFSLRTRIMKLDSELKKLEKSGVSVETLKQERKLLLSAVEYAPTWVLVLVALSLGLGTMVGWKRIVVTIGEKIGKAHLTYAQGAVAELVAMSTIGLSAIVGVPVSTTHCLSSGVAGSMVANRSGVQPSTIRSILLAWVLTLPVTIVLSAGLFMVLSKVLA
jgi:PiT family inorganic phosphate transporter